jgi:hypothetical protein
MRATYMLVVVLVELVVPDLLPSIVVALERSSLRGPLSIVKREEDVIALA